MQLTSIKPFPVVIILLFTFCLIPPVHAEEGMSTIAIQDTTSVSDVPSFRAVGFLQQHFTYNTGANNPAAFSIYRARIGIAGRITDQISVNIVAGGVEPPDRNPHLVNAFIDVDIDPLLNIRTGQFLVPFGLEGPEVITFNPAIERSIAVRRLNTVNMFRDIGVRASGSTDRFNYAVAVVNGAGANNAVQIDSKDLLGRIGFVLTEDLEVGLSGHLGRYRTGPNNDFRRYRAGADFRYDLNPLLVRGEVIFREDELPGDTALNQIGGYLLGAYELADNWQAIARFEFHDPNRTADDNSLTAWTLGMNYYITGQSRISANYELRNDRNNPDLGDLFTVQFQIAL